VDLAAADFQLGRGFPKNIKHHTALLSYILRRNAKIIWHQVLELIGGMCGYRGRKALFPGSGYFHKQDEL